MQMLQGARWIIFYTDGSTFTHVDGEPHDAPRRSVQTICSVRPDDDWYFINQCDYYYWEQENKHGLQIGGWNNADFLTIFDHLLRAKYPCVLFGRMLSDAQWQEVHADIVTYCNTHRDFIIGRDNERPPQSYR